MGERRIGIVVLSFTIALAFVRAQLQLPSESLCQTHPETVASPDKYPPEAPTCAEYENLIPLYSYNPKCLESYNRLRCNWDSWNDLIGLPDWSVDDLDVVCGSECNAFSLYFVQRLYSNPAKDSGCIFVALALYDLCSTRNTIQYCFDYDAQGLPEDLQAYWEGNPENFRKRCLGLSICDENKWMAMTEYFRLDGIGELEDLFDNNYPNWKVALPSLQGMCSNIINSSFESVTYLDPDLDTGAFAVDNYYTFYSLDPYIIHDKGEGSSECNSTTAISPSHDGTCPSFDDWISTSGANESCVNLVKNIRCNIDTVASMTSPGFFLTSEVESMCTGVCAPYIKYVIETLRAQNTSSEPGCDVIRTSLEGVCTQYTWSNQTDFCASRGSAFSWAFKTYLTEDILIAQERFASVCAAYSCCEDAHLTTLPYYFEMTSPENSSIEEILLSWFPGSVAARNISTSGLCTEFAKADTQYITQIGSNGDTCSSTLGSVTAFKPLTVSPTTSPTTSSPTASPTTGSPTISPTSATPSSSSGKSLNIGAVMLAIAVWIGFLIN